VIGVHRTRIRRPLRLGSRITGSAAAAGIVAGFVLDTTANQLGALGRWVPWVVVVCGILASATLWTLSQRETEVPEIIDRRSLTDRSPLIGRQGVIAEAVRKAQAHRCVLVRGPRGVGTSAVAIEALLRLVPEPGQRHWVDAFDQTEREVQLNVLRTLDLPVARAGDNAVELVMSRLRNSGEALLIDNVTEPAQVRWIARPIAKAYVIIAGDLAADALRGVAETTVAGLAPDEGLRLFCHPYGLAPPESRPRWSLRSWLRRDPRPPSTIEKRVAAERGLAEELARNYLLRPRIVKEVGRTFDANPNLTVSDLLEVLRQDTQSQLSERLRGLFQSLLIGVPKEGRRLIAMMKPLPYVAYDTTALATLTGWSVTRTDACLADLASRDLVHRGPGGVRLAEQTGTLRLDIGRRRRARARRRLYAYYADLAGEHADQLGTDEYAEARTWFAASDAVLKRLILETEPIAEVVAIADALEVWFAQEGRKAEREAVAQRLVGLESEPATSIGHLRLAAIARTAKDLPAASRHLDQATAFRHLGGRPQWYTESALQNLDRSDPTAARADVEQCVAARPPSDGRGRIGDEINLGVIAIRESTAGTYGTAVAEDHRAESLERALRHFNQALDLAEAIHEISGQAHALEMIGVVHAEQQNTSAARGDWQTAGRLWARIGDEAGRHRCERRRAGVPTL
jgi:hypothetical protein